MPISVRDALQQSGQLSNWLGSSNDAYERMSTPTPPKESFIHNVGSSLAKIPMAVAGAVAGGFKGAENLVQGTARNIGSHHVQAQLDQNRKALEAKDIAIHQQYKTGKLSAQQYKAAQHGLMQEYQKLSETAKGIVKDHYGAADVAKDYASAAGTALALAAPFAAPAVAGVEGAAGAASLAAKATGALDSSFGVKAAQAGIKGLPGALARNTLAVQPTIQVGADLPANIAKGNYAGAIGDAALLAAPAAFGAASKYLPNLGKSTNTALYGREGFFNAISKAGGPDLIHHLDTIGAKEAKALEDTLRKVQQYNLDQTGGDAKQAASEFVAWLERGDRSISDISPEQMSKELKTWVSANEKANRLFNAGKVLDGAGKPVVLKPGQRIIAGRFDVSDKKALVDMLGAAKTVEERQAILAQQAKAGADWAKNPNLEAELSKAVKRDDWKSYINKEIQGTREMFTSGKNTHLGGGYFTTIADNTRAGFKAVKDTAEIDRGKAAGKVMGKVGTVLRKTGVSTESQDPMAYRRFKANLTSELKSIGQEPNSVIQKIADFTKTHRGFSDERQLSLENIKDAVGGLGEGESRAIKKAYMNAHDAMSVSDTSLAGKIENNLYHIPGYGTYRRIQGIGRYELNPAFRAQERVETEVLSQIMAKGKTPEYPGAKMIDRIFNSGSNTGKLDKTINILNEKGIFANEGYGSFAANTTNFSTISAKLSKAQQRSVAGLINTLAEKAGLTAEEFISTADSKIVDNIRSVVQYPKSGFTSSNFSKTANLLVFPSRYTTKLAMFLGKELAKASPVTQIATLKGIHDLGSYLNSDEGIKWQSENSEALGILRYFNPLANLNGVFKLASGKGTSISDFGVIGGLPLGIVTQLLQTSGALPNAQQAYLNPKTGEVVPDKIPTGLAGAVKLSLSDLVNSAYSFPGRTLGTNLSKRQLTEGFLPMLKPGKGETKDAPTPELTDFQKRQQQVLGAGKTKTPSTDARPATSSIKYNTPKVSPIELKPGQIKLKAPKAAKGKIYARRPKV